MAQTQLNASLGASSSPFETDIGYNPKESFFDFSKKLFSTADIGKKKVVDWFPCVPGDRHHLKIRYILDSLPLSVPPMTNYKVKFSAYYARWQDLWKGAETYVTKGRSGSIELEKPSICYTSLYPKEDTITDDDYYLDGPNTLIDDMGVPVIHYNGSGKLNYLPFANKDASITKNGAVKINALPFFMYQKIIRNDSMPSNLMQDCKCWFPDDISSDDWRIDYDGSNLSEDGLFVPIGQKFSSDDGGLDIARFIPQCSGDDMDNCVNILQSRYDMFGIDPWTSAKPWLVRGEETSLDMDVTGLVHTVSAQDVSLYDDSPLISSPTYGPTLYGGNNYGFHVRNQDSDVFNHRFVSELEKIKVETTGNPKAQLTANTLRQLIAVSVVDEISALTDGNYNSFVRSVVGKDPRHEDFEPKWIGGCSDFINFSPIFQTSDISAESPLGKEAGKGSVMSSGDLGTVFCEDYGYVMIIMSIVPEVSYTQGLPKELTELDSTSVFLPEYCSLGFEPIKNKEVFVTGDPSVDEDLFGYQTRDFDKKARVNTVNSLCALSSTEDRFFSAYAQSRQFEECPKLSNQFVTASPLNTRRDFLAFPNLPAFRLQLASDVESIRPLPYKSVPNRFGV